MEIDFATTHSILLKLALALLLGTLIGLERQYRQQPTGLVTHALVAMGAAAYSSLPGALGLELDLRMGAQVVTGIGFLGAGLIIRDGMNIKGLSTSATIWSTGSIGVFIGYGFLLLAIETTILVVILNVFLPRISRYFDNYIFSYQDINYHYIIAIKCPIEHEAATRANFLQALSIRTLRFSSIASYPAEGNFETEIKAVLFSHRNIEKAVLDLATYLGLEPNVRSVTWAPTAENALQNA